MAEIDRGVKAYLDGLPREQRDALEKLRRTVRSVLPDATEVMTYGVPTFKQRKAVVSYGAAKHHCSLYVMSTAVIDACAGELAGYDTAKGTVRFAADKPLPDTLVTRLVRARLAENEANERAARERQSAGTPARRG